MKLAKGLEKLEQIDINSIKHDPQNAKIHTDRQIKQLARIIETEGFTDPVVIGYIKDNKEDAYCVSGNGRLLALKELSKENAIYSKVPVSYLAFNDDAQRKSFALKHNAIQQETGFDKDITESILKDIESLNKLEFENIKELDFQSLNAGTIEAVNNILQNAKENDNNKSNTILQNTEIDIDNIDISKCKIVFTYDATMYESVLSKINLIKISKNLNSLESVLLELLDNYHD